MLPMVLVFKGLVVSSPGYLSEDKRSLYLQPCTQSIRGGTAGCPVAPTHVLLLCTSVLIRGLDPGGA